MTTRCYFQTALLGTLLAAGPLAWGHPHLPHPMGAPKEGTIEDAKEAAALPAETRAAIVDGGHHPEDATEILNALAQKTELRELEIYGATAWAADAFAPLRDFKRLEVLRIFDDSTIRKPGHLDHIANVPTLRILRLYYSGD